MRKYTEDNANEVLKAKEIGEKQFREQIENRLDYENAICFMYFDITIVNPFMDDTGRYEFSLDDAYEFYGSRFINWFIDNCNKD